MIKNYLDKFNLKNKKAFIIGGCGLLGSEISEALISVNAKVYVFDVDKKKGKILEKNFINKKFEYIYFDLSDTDNIDKKIKIFIKKYGCPDIFINCSYPSTKDWSKSSFSTNSLKLLKKNVDLHLNSHTWLSFKICESMKQKKIKGTVINFGSIYGLVGQNMSVYKKTKIRENMNYSIIKGGIINFSKQLASYYGKNNIRVNAICPGGIKGHVKGRNKSQDKRFVKNYSELCPLGRLGTAQEIAASVLFLASDASSYITGSAFTVDGGWTSI